jgi:hypothetical protein
LTNRWTQYELAQKLDVSLKSITNKELDNNVHPKAKRCYAWSYQDKGETQYVNVLEIPPVVSPKTAVQAAIVSGAQK